ncbi:MAG: hypothetical protein AB7Q37_08395 [Pyrinomonadaceae bacterium]
MGRYLNSDMGFEEVRWRISRDISPDFLPSFDGTPVKCLLKDGTSLVRLIWVPTETVLEGVWWMPRKVFDQLRNENNQAEHGSGRQLRTYIGQALSLPSANYQLSVAEIELVQPVYGWEGLAAPLFGRPGGSKQFYIPNLSEPGNPRHSLHARVLRTYWLRF